MPRISELTRVNEVSDGDVFPIEQASSGRTRSVAFKTIRDDISADVDAAVSVAVAAAAAAELAAASSDAQVLREELADGATALKGADLVAYDAVETVRDAIAASKQFDADLSNTTDPTKGAALVGYDGGSIVKNLVYESVAADTSGLLAGKRNLKPNTLYASIAADVHTCWIGYGGIESFPNIIGTIPGSGANYSGVLGYDNKTDALATAMWHFHGTINTAADHPTMIGGSYGTILGGSYNAMIGGTQNTIDGGNYVGIFGGQNNRIVSGSGSAIVAGSGNIIESDGHSNIGGGLTNEILAGSNQSLIAGGGSNKVGGVGNTVGGGRFNEILAGEYSAIGGGNDNSTAGNYNTVSGGKLNATGSASGSFVGGGYGNQATNGHTVVAGGLSNTASGDLSNIAGGQSNAASGTQASIYGGRQNVASGQYSVAGGRESTADGSYSKAEGYQSSAQYGSRAWASGGFSGVRGSSQEFTVVSRIITTTATETNQFADGVASSVVIPENSAWAIETTCLATDGTDRAMFKFAAVAHRGTGSTAASPTQNDPVTVVYASAGAATWSHRITFSTNGTMNVKATGEAGKTIRWTTTSRIVQIKL